MVDSSYMMHLKTFLFGFLMKNVLLIGIYLFLLLYKTYAVISSTLGSRSHLTAACSLNVIAGFCSHFLSFDARFYCLTIAIL